MNSDMSVLEIASRLFAAALAGCIVGLHFRTRPGGLRTHMIATLASALFCVTASRLEGGGSTEVARAIQGIASGVGFIGAASVLRRDGQIEGVANAASLWIAAAIGCEAGAGSIGIALGAAVLEAGAVAAMFHFEQRYVSNPPRRGAVTDETSGGDAGD